MREDVGLRQAWDVPGRSADEFGYGHRKCVLEELEGESAMRLIRVDVSPDGARGPPKDGSNACALDRNEQTAAWYDTAGGSRPFAEVNLTAVPLLRPGHVCDASTVGVHFVRWGLPAVQGADFSKRRRDPAARQRLHAANASIISSHHLWGRDIRSEQRVALPGPPSPANGA